MPNAPANSDAADKPHQKPHHKPVGIKETLTSLVIAFMLAFVFRGFVIEGFIIPTGSMAPTLLGKHLRFESPYNGYDWTTGPWDNSTVAGREPNPRQGGQPKVGGGLAPALTPTDPMTLLAIPGEENRRLAAGDRVFVLKYLPRLHHPKRWDVVVFKDPGKHENYIKRLLGLPGEQISLVDGDVFVRPYVAGETLEAGPDAWRADDWSIARKSERTQRTMFQPVFDSRFTPILPEPSYRPPVSPDAPGAWSGIETSGTWSYDAQRPTRLGWNQRRPITDAYAYNQTVSWIKLDASPDDPTVRAFRPYPVSDLAISVAVEPTESPVAVTPNIRARGYVFQGVVDPVAKAATVRMRPEGDRSGDEAGWTVLDTGAVDALAAGRVTKIEFWHVDQALWLFVDGKLVCGGADKGAYRLSPAGRLEAAMVPTFEEMVENDTTGNGINEPGVFARNDLYRAAEPGVDFAGGPFKVHRFQIDRDIYHQATPASNGRATRGAHYNNFPTLAGDQFFMSGDNSPNSEDSRYWTEQGMHPWVRDLIDNTPGVINRDLIVGKAFVVYFPAPLDGGPILAPDIGRVRWIW
jgi:signal peptidase I